MSLKPHVRQAIAHYLHTEISRYIMESVKADPAIDTKPFHARLLPALFSVELSERSFSTRSGSWFQEIARLVARQYNERAECNYTLHGQIQPAASAHIENLLHQMDKWSPRRIPNRSQDIQEVLTVQTPNGASLAVTADLFVQTPKHQELYFEMKTPQPNKGQCIGMKRFILQIIALRAGNQAQSFASSAYNPYGDGKPYTWNYAQQFLEIGKDILLGRDFWTVIGEPSTYDELLKIAEEVGGDLLPVLAAKAAAVKQ